MVKQIKMFQIITDTLSKLVPKQIGNESTADTELGFKMWGGKDEAGDITRFLAKDQLARVKKLFVKNTSESPSRQLEITVTDGVRIYDNEEFAGFGLYNSSAVLRHRDDTEEGKGYIILSADEVGFHKTTGEEMVYFSDEGISLSRSDIPTSTAIDNAHLFGHTFFDPTVCLAGMNGDGEPYHICTTSAFDGTCTGVNGVVSASIPWEITGNQVSLSIPEITAVSSATDFTITGLPSILMHEGVHSHCLVYDQELICDAIVKIVSPYKLVFYIGVVGCDGKMVYAPGNFANSDIKGVPKQVITFFMAGH